MVKRTMFLNRGGTKDRKGGALKARVPRTQRRVRPDWDHVKNAIPKMVDDKIG